MKKKRSPDENPKLPDQGAPSDLASKLSYGDQLKLDAFLRDAAAVMATGRGWNAESRLKLEALAYHQNLPERLRDQAIAQLQTQRGRFVQKNRYEQAFVEFLDRELARLQSDVLSFRAARRAVAIAKSKYQIHEELAEKLIDERTRLAAVDRILSTDATKYAISFVGQRIGLRTELDDESTNSLHVHGKRLGLSSAEVDAEIERVLRLNQSKIHISTKRLWSAIGLAVLLLLVGAIALVSFGALLARWGAPLSNPLATSLSDEGGTEDQVWESSALPPPWMSPEAVELAESISLEFVPIDLLKNALFSEDKEVRGLGYPLLVSHVFRDPKPVNVNFPSQDRSRFQTETADIDLPAIFETYEQAERLMAVLFAEEPESELVFEMIDGIEDRLRGESDVGIDSVGVLFQQYHANRVLGLIAFHRHADSRLETISRERKNRLFKQISELTRTSHMGLSFHDWIRKSEAQLATHQWNQLIQSVWSQRHNVAACLEPLTELARNRLSAEQVYQFRARLLFDLLEREPDQWRSVQPSLRAVLQQLEDDDLQIAWCEMIVASSSASFQKFAAPILLEHLNWRAHGGPATDALQTLGRFLTQRKTERIQPLLDRRRRVSEQTLGWLETFRVSQQESGPEFTAQLAWLTNLNLALAQKFESNLTSANVDDLDRIDDRLALVRLRLRDLVSLPSESQKKKFVTPTASDLRTKDQSLRRISNRSPEFSGRRINSLAQLEAVVGQFDDLSYPEAVVLADYFLTVAPAAEWLNIQQRISAFSEWPGLGLAIADRLGRSDLQRDQALTVCRLIFGEEFEPVIVGPQWRQPLIARILRISANRLNDRSTSETVGSHADWIRLERFLEKLYRERVKLLPNNRLSWSPLPSSTPENVLFAVVQHEFHRADVPTSAALRLERKLKLIETHDRNPVWQAAQLNQLFLEILGDATEAGDLDQAQWKPFEITNQIDLVRQTLSVKTHADQLFLSELDWLEWAVKLNHERVQQAIDPR